MSGEQLDKFVLVGLPQSGKSTFLAALWHVVESGELDESITLTSLPENTEYLTELRKRWFSCIPLERNKSETLQPISLNCKSSSGQSATFDIPDVAGELYELQFSTRKITKEFASTVKETNGIILFVDPQTLRKPYQISDGQKAQEEIKGKAKAKKTSPAKESVVEATTVSTENETPTSTIPDPWKHKEAPAQVVLVDLLQIVSEFAEKNMKIAVVISAWDIIKNWPVAKHRELKPEEWLEKETPLLFQYLIANQDKHPFTIFGISAQGATYNGANESLHKLPKASDRLIVQHKEQINHDISAPLKWLLTNEG